MSRLAEAAESYARHGWRVFPLHPLSSIAGVEVCSCSQTACDKAGKHPLIGNWVEAATSDPDAVRRWWSQWPEAGIGLATGRQSGVWVVDVDAPKIRQGGARVDGEQSLWAWQAQNGQLPETLSSRTGRGGRHLFFQTLLGTEIRSGVDVLGRGSGVDVRGEGGYVVLPPSRSTYGGYEWLTAVPPAVPPPALLGALEGRSGGGSVSGLWSLTRIERLIDEGIPLGSRNQTLISVAGYLFRRFREAPREAYSWLERLRAAMDPPMSVDEYWLTVSQAEGYVERERAEAQVGQEGSRPPLTDDGNVDRLVELIGDDFRYTAGAGWLKWDGQVWVPDHVNEITWNARRVGRTLESTGYMAWPDAERADARRWGVTSQNASRVEAMVKLARVDPRLACRFDDFDRDDGEARILVCENGTLSLSLGEGADLAQDLEFLPEHRREDLQTRQVAAPWHPDAPCPAWEQFTARVIPDPEVRAYVQRALGYTLSGRATEKALFILHGSGDNGKSVLINFIELLLGGYATTLPPQALLLRRGGDSSPHDLMPLRGARMAVASETNEGERLDAKTVKRLTGGDRVKARNLYQSWVEFENRAVVWMMTNNRPGVRDYSEAMWERIKLVPFEVTISREERLPPDLLRARFWDERAGILRWLVEGYVEWAREGLREPERVRFAVDEYRYEESWVDRFVAEVCDLDAGSVTLAKDLWVVYQRWSMTIGEEPLTLAQFSRSLGSQVEKVRSSFKGIRLKPEFVNAQATGSLRGM